MAFTLVYLPRCLFCFWPLSLQDIRFSTLCSITGYSSPFISVFGYKIPGICVGFFLWDLLRSFGVEGPFKSVGSPASNSSGA